MLKHYLEIFMLVTAGGEPLKVNDLVLSIAALATLGTVIYLYVVARPVPDQLAILLGTFVGYFVNKTNTVITTSENK